MRAQLKYSGCTELTCVDFLALSGEGHGVYDEQTRRDVYERILQFLSANLSVPCSSPGRNSMTPSSTLP